MTKYLLKMSHISLLLEKVTKSWEISVGRDEGGFFERDLIVFQNFHDLPQQSNEDEM